MKQFLFFLFLVMVGYSIPAGAAGDGKATMVEKDWCGLYYFDTESDGDEYYPFFYYLIALDNNKGGKGLTGKMFSTECVEGFVSIYDIKITATDKEVVIKTLGGVGVNHLIERLTAEGEIFRIKKDGKELKVVHNGRTYELTKREKERVPANIKDLKMDMYGVIGNTIGTLELNGTSGKYSYLNNIDPSNGEYFFANRVIKKASLNGNHLTIPGYDKAGKRIGVFDGVYNGWVYSGVFTNYKGVKIEFYLWKQE